MNISFAHPWMLLLLALPVWLVIWTWRRDDRRIALPFDHGKGRAGRGIRFVLSCAESLPGVLLAIAVILAAGPQKLGVPKTKRILTNIEFCVDVSGSMTAPFGEGTRYDGSMQAINEFLSYRTGDAFGLTFFGHNVLHWVPLTSDISAFAHAPPFMRPEVAPPWMGGTMIGKALLACKDILASREEGDRMVVLVSDGASADLHNGADEEVARTLRENNITVFHIHISDTPIPDEIITVTAKTGGEAFAVDDSDALGTIFRRIDSMKATRLEKTAPETIDDFAPYCVAGLSVLSAIGLALLGVRYTPW